MTREVYGQFSFFLIDTKYDNSLNKRIECEKHDDFQILRFS